VPWWPYLLGVAALVAVGAGLWFRSRPRVPTRTIEVPVEPPPPSPEEVALAGLARLRGISPEGRTAVQRWYVEASTLVREYVAARYAVPAEHLTTEECVAAVGAIGDAARLRRFLRHCDGVKFARHRVDVAEREQRLDDAEAFVREAAC
jgi:hypothetical protein